MLQLGRRTPPVRIVDLKIMINELLERGELCVELPGDQDVPVEQGVAVIEDLVRSESANEKDSVLLEECTCRGEYLSLNSGVLVIHSWMRFSK